MSLRTLIRVGALALGLVLFSPLLWQAAGSWSLLAGLGLLALSFGYLLLMASGGQTTRWQVRYQMETRQANERLDAVLSFLADKAGHVVVEANQQGLFLEAPVAFDRYVQVQLERVLPQARVSRGSNTAKEAVAARPPFPKGDLRSVGLRNSRRQAGETLYLSLDPLAGDPLRWATEQPDRRVRLHLHRGSYTTLTARTTNGIRPPGRWMHIPAPQLVAARLGRNLPVWDELAVGTGVRPSHLLPTTDDGSVFSSRSRLLQMAPPDSYHAGGERTLGESSDGRLLSLSHDVPLFTVGAPSSFLVQQVIADLRQGRTVIAVSPQRRVLNLIQRQAQTMTYWLDPENARASAHLAVVNAAEWATQSVETAIRLSETFLADLPALYAARRPGGLDLRLPVVRSLVRHLVRILAASAAATGHDFAFTDLYAISQSTQTLRAFLVDLQGLTDDPSSPDSAEDSTELCRSLVAGSGQRLDPETQGSIHYLADQLEDDAGYVQVVTVLSTLRAVLRPLRGGAIHILCRPPFLNVSKALSRPGLLLVPLANAGFPEYDRFLAAMLTLVLDHARTANPNLRLALHLHDPHRYLPDAGQHWVETARQDPRLSLLLDVQDPDAYSQVHGEEDGELIFRCSEALASSLIGDWDLAYSIAEFVELPTDTALRSPTLRKSPLGKGGFATTASFAVARLPGLPGPVTLKTGGDE